MPDRADLAAADGSVHGIAKSRKIRAVGLRENAHAGRYRAFKMTHRTARQVINRDHLVAVTQQGRHEMTGDKAGPTRNYVQQGPGLTRR
jgi:hypothetical protein